jgi:predicted naringenin-chalcone synthase
VDRRAETAPAVLAVGTAVPEHAHRQEDLVTFMAAAHDLDAAGARRLRHLYRSTRIETRYSCLADYGRSWRDFDFFPRNPRLQPAPTTAERMEVFRREAPRLAERAGRDLFLQAGVPAPDQIDHLFVVTCTGFFSPGLDVVLVDRLGLRPNIGRTVVGFQGCQGGLTALRLADAVCRARPGSKALVVCVELSTLHFQGEPTDENLLANALFADGAAAALVSSSLPPPGRARIEIHETTTSLLAGSRGGMVWSIGDRGFELHLSDLVPRILAAELPAALDDALGMDAPRLAADPLWAVHPGGAAILDQVERAFGLPADRLRSSREVLRRYGNMSSATIFFVLRAMLADRALVGPGLALAFGPGLTVEAARITKIGRGATAAEAPGSASAPAEPSGSRRLSREPIESFREAGR